VPCCLDAGIGALMLRLQWNELRVGDRVLVHDVDDAGLALIAGVVTVVQPAPGSNEVAIRLAGHGNARSRVVSPQRLAVHMDPQGLDEGCWRCALPRR
jgi:hypothetical protein